MQNLLLRLILVVGVTMFALVQLSGCASVDQGWGKPKWQTQKWQNAIESNDPALITKLYNKLSPDPVFKKMSVGSRLVKGGRHYHLNMGLDLAIDGGFEKAAVELLCLGASADWLSTSCDMIRKGTYKRTESGCKFKLVSTKDGITLLGKAVKGNQADTVAALLDAGANPNRVFAVIDLAKAIPSSYALSEYVTLSLGVRDGLRVDLGGGKRLHVVNGWTFNANWPVRCVVGTPLSLALSRDHPNERIVQLLVDAGGKVWPEHVTAAKIKGLSSETITAIKTNVTTRKDDDQTVEYEAARLIDIITSE